MRRGQSTVETLLLISVVCVGIVAVGWLLGGDFMNGARSMAEGAGSAYVEPSRAP
ncbi:MAG: hypothetical protein GY913_25730 [Proteobacteria bacterium]|nr:hypothetical protein [Pseudomonadota bacterium]MCP4920316.1 hypothetical protein [Pseudomonadota bacterium]